MPSKQLEQCQRRMHAMEDRLEDPTQTDRVRFLEGDDPSPTQLQEQLETVGYRKLLTRPIVVIDRNG